MFYYNTYIYYDYDKILYLDEEDIDLEDYRDEILDKLEDRIVKHLGKRLSDFTELDFYTYSNQKDDIGTYIDMTFKTNTELDQQTLKDIFFRDKSDYYEDIDMTFPYGSKHDYSYYEEPSYDETEETIRVDVYDIKLVEDEEESEEEIEIETIGPNYEAKLKDIDEEIKRGEYELYSNSKELFESWDKI